jgi:hypothetical protein
MMKEKQRGNVCPKALYSYTQQEEKHSKTFLSMGKYKERRAGGGVREWKKEMRQLVCSMHMQLLLLHCMEKSRMGTLCMVHAASLVSIK